jgi:hypothetical protein
MFSKSNMYTNNLLQIVEGFYLILYRLTLLQYLIPNDIKEIDSSLLDSNSLINLIKFEDLTLWINWFIKAFRF